MPTIYKRKGSISRGNWSSEALQDAIQAVNNGLYGVNEAARQFNIPKTTLKRRIQSNNISKPSRLGPSSTLGDAVEKKLVDHIKKLQKSGFCPTRYEVRKMAFNLAEKMNLRHKFSKDKEIAGYDWLLSFLNRNKEISVRKSEGVSIARAEGLSRSIVDKYFVLLESVLRDNDMFDKPQNIFNVDETGLQLNNKPGLVLAGRGSKSVPAVTSGEKGETISLIACCNAEGMFIPPYCILKGKNRKEEFGYHMPSGSNFIMSPKSAYVNTEIFLSWLRTHFLPRKPKGKTLLILDGHTSHTASVELLEFCEANDIIMLCLPSHTTHYLQPLDRSFFKSLKSHYYAACNNFLKTNPTRKINRLVFGELLNTAWGKSATVENGTSGFKACGIFPFEPNRIPDYAFLTDEIQQNANGSTNSHTVSRENSPVPGRSRDLTPPRSDNMTPMKSFPLPSCSIGLLTTNTLQNSEASGRTSKISPQKSKSSVKKNTTPGHLLQEISPIPVVSSVDVAKKRGRQIAQILNDPENIRLKRVKQDKTTQQKKKTSVEKPKVIGKRQNMKKKKKIQESSSDSDTDNIEVEEESELEVEDFSDLQSVQDSDTLNNKNNGETPDLCTESYYCVYYDSMYYLGRVINLLPDGRTKLKFLKPDFDKWIWPKEDDISEVQNQFIFHGPVKLSISYPFSLSRHDYVEAERKFKMFKSKATKSNQYP